MNKKKKKNEADSSSDEFARGDSIPISETLRQEIKFVKDGGANRYDGLDSQRETTQAHLD